MTKQGEGLGRPIKPFHGRIGGSRFNHIHTHTPHERFEFLPFSMEASIRKILWKHGLKPHLFRAAEKQAWEQSAFRMVSRRSAESGMLQLQELLSLPTPPRRLECVTTSNVGRTETIGSMGVQCGGFEMVEQYRSFLVHSRHHWSDRGLGALKKVLRRRLQAMIHDLSPEEQLWRERGVTFGRAKEEERGFIQQTLADHAGEVESIVVDEREFLVARRGSEVVAFGRVHRHGDGALELASLFVAESERGRHLGSFLSRILLHDISESVYAVADPKLGEYYADVGFRTVRIVPRSIVEKDERLTRLYPNEPPCILLRFEASQHRLDPSLSRCPDLLVIEGGQKRLQTAWDVVSSLALSIPVLGVSPWEGELFLPHRSSPVRFSARSEAATLLGRLRYETHRFASFQREWRMEKHTVGSFHPFPMLRALAV